MESALPIRSATEGSPELAIRLMFDALRSSGIHSGTCARVSWVHFGALVSIAGCGAVAGRPPVTTGWRSYGLAAAAVVAERALEDVVWAERRLIEHYSPCFNVALNARPTPLSAQYAPPGQEITHTSSLSMNRPGGCSCFVQLKLPNCSGPVSEREASLWDRALARSGNRPEQVFG
jgi:hypothetical protein